MIPALLAAALGGTPAGTPPAPAAVPSSSPAAPAASPTAPAASQAPAKQTRACPDAGAVDWANHAHPLLHADRLTDGVAEVGVHRPDRALPELYRWTLRAVHTGDLDGDGCDEAITWLTHAREGAMARGGPEGGQGFVWRLAPDGEVLLGRVYGAEAATPRFEGGQVVIGAVRWAYAGGGFEPLPYAVPGAAPGLGRSEPGGLPAGSPGPAVRAASSTPKPEPPACRDLRAVDWKNHTFPGIFGRLHDGRAEYREYGEIGGLHDTSAWSLAEVVYRDLDGDACAEAVTVIRAFYAAPNGASREWTEAWVWRATSDAELSLGHADGPEDAEVRVVAGVLHVGDGRWRVRGRTLEPLK